MKNYTVYGFSTTSQGYRPQRHNIEDLLKRIEALERRLQEKK
jgi:hypothetical protein